MTTMGDPGGDGSRTQERGAALGSPPGATRPPASPASWPPAHEHLVRVVTAEDVDTLLGGAPVVLKKTTTQGASELLPLGVYDVLPSHDAIDVQRPAAADLDASQAGRP